MAIHTCDTALKSRGVSQRQKDDLAPALMEFATPLLRFDISLRTRSACTNRRILVRWRWEKGEDHNCLCITWIVTAESLETALL